MLNLESRIYQERQEIKRAKTINIAYQHAYYAYGLLDAKMEDGKISESHKKTLRKYIEDELTCTEKKIQRKGVDKTLDLFRKAV